MLVSICSLRCAERRFVINLEHSLWKLRKLTRKCTKLRRK